MRGFSKTRLKRGELRAPPIQNVVPGTNFTVDWHCKTFPKYQHSFLTHAHTDHVNGIQSFRRPRTLHCTKITAKMIVLKYPQIHQCIQTCDVGSSFVIDDVKIHVLDANHTPGSAMFLFELKNGKKILHTGDCRADNNVVNSIRPFSPVDHLYLDCTFALQPFKFPSREDCFSFVLERTTDLIATGYLIAFGTYTIGKEDIAFKLAEAQNCKIWANETRMKTLKSLVESGYTPGYLLSETMEGAKMHIINIADCSNENAIAYAKSINQNKIALFSFSGWNMKNAYWQIPTVLSSDEIKCILYSIPYSDHSSLTELKELVKVVQPSHITSITDKSAKSIEKINKLFFPFIRKASNRNFLDYYATPKVTLLNEENDNDVQEIPSSPYIVNVH